MTQPDPHRYSVSEAAQLAGKSRSTLYRLIAQGRVPHRVMSTGEIKLTAADVDQIIRADQPREVLVVVPRQPQG